MDNANSANFKDEAIHIVTAETQGDDHRKATHEGDGSAVSEGPSMKPRSPLPEFRKTGKVRGVTQECGRVVRKRWTPDASSNPDEAIVESEP